MKVLKIEPKDRLTEYTHIEIQGITIPISNIDRVSVITSTLSIHTKRNGISGRLTIDLDTTHNALYCYTQINNLIKP